MGSGLAFLPGGVSESIRLGGEIPKEGKIIQPLRPSKIGYSLGVYVGLDRGAGSDHGTSNITSSAASPKLEDSVLLYWPASYYGEIDSCHRDSDEMVFIDPS